MIGRCYRYEPIGAKPELSTLLGMMVNSEVGDPRSVTRLGCTCVISEQQHISVTIVVSNGAQLPFSITYTVTVGFSRGRH
jgi:hypothetical protein